jgi:hypothetical protein
MLLYFKGSKGGRHLSNSQKLIGYCGMRCEACAMYTGEIKAAVSRLKELVVLYELGRVSVILGGRIEDFPQFLKTLERLEDIFGKCEGCRAGGGWIDCPMRKCCMKKGLKYCHECDAMPCQELLQFQKKHFLSPVPHYVKHG